MPSEVRSIDTVLEQSGPFTPYQIIIQIATTYLCLVTSYNNVLALFTGDDPPWRCSSNSSSTFCASHPNTTIDKDSALFGRRCDLQRTEWEFLSTDEYSFVTEYDLVCGKTWIAALVTSAYYVGGVFGCSVSGIAADTFGRKPIILMSLVATSLSMVLSCFVTGVWQLGLLNMIGGAGTYGSFMCSNVYQAEIIPPKYRAISTNILLTGFTFSFFIVDLFAYYVRDWRLLSAYVAIPSVAAMMAFLWLPESPRWLLVSGKQPEAREVIKKIARVDVPYIAAKEPGKESGGGGGEGKSYSFYHLFNNLVVLKLTLSIGVIWFMMTIIWYTIALETGSLGGDMYQAFALSNISDLLSYVCAVILCNKFGRKKCIMGNFLITGVLLVILVIIRLSSSSNYLVNLVLTSLARLSINTAAGGIFVWTNELFPTILRSRGYFFCALCDRVSVIAVPFITRLLQEVNPVMPYVISTVLSGCGFVVGFLLPETLNQPTRETYDDFFPKRTEETAEVTWSASREEPFGVDNVGVEGDSDVIDTDDVIDADDVTDSDAKVDVECPDLTSLDVNVDV